MAGINWQGPSEWNEWTDWLSSGLHGRNQWRLSVILSGMLFAFGRRTVTTWLRAAGVSASRETPAALAARKERFVPGNGGLVNWVEAAQPLCVPFRK